MDIGLRGNMCVVSSPTSLKCFPPFHGLHCFWWEICLDGDHSLCAGVVIFLLWSSPYVWIAAVRPQRASSWFSLILSYLGFTEIPESVNSILHQIWEDFDHHLLKYFLSCSHSLFALRFLLLSVTFPSKTPITQYSLRSHQVFFFSIFKFDISYWPVFMFIDLLFSQL